MVYSREAQFLKFASFVNVVLSDRRHHDGDVPKSFQHLSGS